MPALLRAVAARPDTRLASRSFLRQFRGHRASPKAELARSKQDSYVSARWKRRSKDRSPAPAARGSRPAARTPILGERTIQLVDIDPLDIGVPT
jgi:hypothetical protein